MITKAKQSLGNQRLLRLMLVIPPSLSEMDKNFIEGKE